MPQTRVEHGSALSMTSWTPAIVVALMVIGASAFAEVSIPPAKARQLLAHLPGMRARPDQHKEELGWTYVAPDDVLRHSSSDAPHDLAYYVYGTAEHVSEMQLVLSVYLKHPREAKTALTTLARDAAELTSKALGQPLPAAAKECIQQGCTGEWQVGLASVQARRGNWPTKKGYTLEVRIK